MHRDTIRAIKIDNYTLTMSMKIEDKVGAFILGVGATIFFISDYSKLISGKAILFGIVLSGFGLFFKRMKVKKINTILGDKLNES